MMHGQPFCPACGHQGPDFMWSWHPRMGVGVLVQDLVSRALRVVEVQDDGTFSAHAMCEEEANTPTANRVLELAGGQLAPTERIVPVAEFVRLDGDPLTDLPCQTCRGRLAWRNTGIS